MVSVADVVRRRIQWVVLVVGMFFQVLNFDLIAAPVIGIASNQSTDIAFSPVTIISARLPGWLMIQFHALAEKPMGTVLSLLFCLLAMGFGLALIFLGQKAEIAANIAIVTACFASLFMSKLFYTLHACHTLSGVYLRALPMPAHYWLIRDWALLGVLISVVLVPMQLMLLIFAETTIGPLMLILIVVWSLLLVFRVVIERLRQQAVLLSSLATGVFLYLFGVVFL